MLPGSSREIEKLRVCEYGVTRLSSIPAVIAKPCSSSPEGNFAGKLPKFGGGFSKEPGRFVSPVKRGLVVAVCTPAGLVMELCIPNDKAPEFVLTASAPPMRS